MRGWGGDCVLVVALLDLKKEMERVEGVREERYFFPFGFPEHKATNATATTDVISVYPFFCLFECLGPITTGGGGGY